MIRALVALAVATPITACGDSTDAPAGQPATGPEVIASREAYDLAKADLGRPAADWEARKYDRQLDRLLKVCASSRGDLGALADMIVEEARREHGLKVRRLSVLRRVVVTAADRGTDCTEAFENYYLLLSTTPQP